MSTELLIAWAEAMLALCAVAFVLVIVRIVTGFTIVPKQELRDDVQEALEAFDER